MRLSNPFRSRTHFLASFIPATFILILASQALGQGARDDYQVGLTLYQQGHYAQAVAHFQSATQVDPSFGRPTRYWASASTS